MLDVQKLTVRHGGLTVLSGVSFTLREGEWLMVAGPNGAGKSTLINAIAQGVPYQGVVRFAGQDVRHMRPTQIARRMGVLSQSHQVGYAFTVREVVNLGRYAYQKSRLSFTDDQAEEMVNKALEMTGMLPFAGQTVTTLSGGELQRTFLAQIFAQDPQVILLDEPANHLDLAYQKQTFELIGEWLKTPGKAALSVVHDISMARAFGTHALLLHKGRPVAYGNNKEVLCRENLQAVYGMDVQGWMQEMLAQWAERPVYGQTR